MHLSTNISCAMCQVHDGAIHVLKAKGGPCPQWTPSFNVVG